MKRFLCIIFTIFCLAPTSLPEAKAEQIRYASILSGAILYSERDLSSPVTSLPETYFVTVVETLGEVSKVTYLGLSGYISNDFISPVDFTPKNKYAKATLSLTNDGGIINVRAYPDHTADNVTQKLTDGTTLEYYGVVAGRTLNQIIGDEWFAVKLSGGRLGYVYSMYAVASQIEPNVVVPEEEDPKISPTTSFSVDEHSSYFLIGALCLPVIVIMYLLFKQKPSGGQS